MFMLPCSEPQLWSDLRGDRSLDEITATEFHRLHAASTASTTTSSSAGGVSCSTADVAATCRSALTAAQNGQGQPDGGNSLDVLAAAEQQVQNVPYLKQLNG